MEPEVKTLLTQKIRAVEREPVAWNKAEVWMKVQHRVSPRSSRLPYYYAAAGVTFLLFGTLFAWQRNQVLPAERTAVKEAPKEMPTMPHPVAAESRPKESVVNNAPLISNTPTEIVYRVSVEELPAIQSNQEEEVTVLKEVVEEPLITFIPPEESIQPIVGVVTEAEHKQIVVTKTKRKKLRMLEPIEKTGTEPAPNLILARIK